MTSISKDVYIDKLDEMVNKYINTYHRTIKMNPADENPRMYIDFNKENNKEGPKFKVDNHVRIRKCKNIFAKIYVPIWFEEAFAITKVKTIIPCSVLLVILKAKKLLERFTENNCQKQIKEFRFEKVIKEKGDKLYVKWKD